MLERRYHLIVKCFMKTCLVLVWSSCILSPSARALQVLEPGYQIDPFISLQSQYVHDIAFDPLGNMYLTLSADNSVVQVKPDRSIISWSTLSTPRQGVWMS